jgi:hypothetical protein
LDCGRGGRRGGGEEEDEQDEQEEVEEVEEEGGGKEEHLDWICPSFLVDFGSSTPQSYYVVWLQEHATRMLV